MREALTAGIGCFNVESEAELSVLSSVAHSMGVQAQPLGSAPAIVQTVAGFEFSSWIGLVAPRGLPAPVAETLQRALAQVLQLAEMRKAFEPHGAIPTPGSPQMFRDFLARDIELNRKAIQFAGVQPE